MTNLLRILADGPSTARELAAALGVSPRTIARDIRLLQNAGVPVYTQPGRDGGVFLQLADGIMGPGEVFPEAFKSLLADTASASGLDAASAAERIGHHFAPASPASSPTARLFSQLKDLVLSHKSARAKYVNGRGRIRRGRLRPEILVWHNDRWALVASASAGALNVYVPLNRLLAIDPDSARTQQSAVLPRSAPCRRVRFLVPLSAAVGVQSLFPRDRLHSTPEGNIEIQVVSVRDMLCMGLLLAALVPVCLSGPADLCERAEAEIRSVYGLLHGDQDRTPHTSPFSFTCDSRSFGSSP